MSIELFVTSKGDDDHASLEHFSTTGWSGPHALLTPEGVNVAVAEYRREHHLFATPSDLTTMSSIDDLARTPWFKSMHFHIPFFAQIALNPMLLRNVVAILGDEIQAWGFGIAERVSGQRHRWHSDVEHTLGPGVTVFLGLEGAGATSSLTVLDGSHQFPVSPQDLGLASNADVMGYASSQASRGHLSTLPSSPGSYCILSGTVWHSSHNASPCTRLAAIIQYSAKGVNVRIPASWDRPVRWLDGSPPSFCVRNGEVTMPSFRAQGGSA